MAVASLLDPVFNNINSKLTAKEREDALNNFTSIYGHSGQEDLVALLQVLARENKITPANTGSLEEGLTDNVETKAAIRETLNNFKKAKRTEIDAWSKSQPREFVGRDVNWLGRMLEEKVGVILWGTYDLANATRSHFGFVIVVCGKRASLCCTTVTASRHTFAITL